jgi:hypothetical protein
MRVSVSAKLTNAGSLKTVRQAQQRRDYSDSKISNSENGWKNSNGYCLRLQQMTELMSNRQSLLFSHLNAST